MTQTLRTAVRAGILQARAELRIAFLTPAFIMTLMVPALFLVFIFQVKESELAGGVSASSFAVPGFLGIGTFQIMGELFNERNDGTLLRLRLLPGGVESWVFGKAVSSWVAYATLFLLTSIPGMILFPDLRPDSIIRLLAFIATLTLSFVTFFPLVALVGSFIRSTWGLLVSMLFVYGIYIASGTMFPANLYPKPLQWLVGLTPMYWGAHASRSALFPAELGSLEITGSFQPLLAVGILAVWALIGYGVTPLILRRSIRRETMGTVAAVREKIASRGYA